MEDGVSESSNPPFNVLSGAVACLRSKIEGLCKLKIMLKTSLIKFNFI